MHKNFVNKIFFIFLVACCFSSLFATDWPIKINESKETSIKYNFAEDRYGLFSTGFVFSTGEEDVTSFADGKMIFTCDANSSYYTQFSSTLGSFAIVAHPDKMVSVYANLSEINQEAKQKIDVVVGEKLGKIIPDDKLRELKKKLETENEDENEIIVPQNFGFHTKKETFEFQVLDTKNNVSINSYLILPKYDKLLGIYPGSIYLENKKGTVYNLDEKKVLPSGSYSVYRDFVPGKMPLSTSILINGKSAVTINYDTVIYKNGILVSSGKENFPFEKIFALPKKQFLGEVQFVRGKNEITTIVTDFNNNSRKITYIVDMY